MALDPRFQLAEASLAELDEIFTLMEIALADDEAQKHAFREVQHQDVHPWIMNVFGPLFSVHHITIYKITEVTAGYGRYSANSK